MSLDELIRQLPKAELHIHIEGTLEPELLLTLAERNRVPVPWDDVESVRDAYRFRDLQSFLDLYYQGAEVLRSSEDFFELMSAYLRRAAADGVRHAEIFFDPQSHTRRGVPIPVFMEGFRQAMADGEQQLGISSGLILCFLRDLPASDAVATLQAAEKHLEGVIGVGLDSAERGNPPEPFAEAYRLARALGLRAVAHAGEEGPPDHIRASLDVLGVERVDHGIRCLDDPGLVARLASEQIPLTVCPLSNVRLRVVDRIEDHPLPHLLEQGLLVTINSDDPAYFGGYVADNYRAVAEAFRLDAETVVQLAANSVEASFLPASAKQQLGEEIERTAKDVGG